MTLPSEAIINTTLKAFQPCYEAELSQGEALEIVQNFTGFVRLLSKLDQKRAETLEKGGNKSW